MSGEHRSRGRGFSVLDGVALVGVVTLGMVGAAFGLAWLLVDGARKGWRDDETKDDGKGREPEEGSDGGAGDEPGDDDEPGDEELGGEGDGATPAVGQAPEVEPTTDGEGA